MSVSPTKRSKRTEKAKKPKRNIFHERLGTLTYYQACQLLGDDAANLIRAAQKYEIQPDRDVYLGGDLFRVRVEDAELGDEEVDRTDMTEAERHAGSGRTANVAIVTMTLQSGRKKQLQLNCDRCDLPCEHLGAAVEFLLDAKSVLGLAHPPDESVPLENLTAEELHLRAIAERQQRADSEAMMVRATDKRNPWADYVVTSRRSGRSYRVAVRSLANDGGSDNGDVFCTCPDFRTNHLGTCKHVLHVQAKMRKRFMAKQLQKPYRRRRVSLRVDYGETRGLLFGLPDPCDEKVREIIGTADHQPLTDPRDVLVRIQSLEENGCPVTIFPDAERLVQRRLTQQRLAQQCEKIRQDPATHPLREDLLRAKLLPYQLDGIAFAAGAGRAILADDMGLGKTIQGIGVAELLARLADIRRVLVVCPASLKSQWRSEIARFCERDSQIIIGSGSERAEQYRGAAFFTICNYEQVLRDVTAIETVDWDLIILDEGQRIKNWESKTSRVIGQLDSPFRLVLSGTPLENRLGELYTVTKFVDEALLGPAYQFFNRHHIVDDRGKTQGYRQLDELRQRLSKVLLRRTRAEIADQLPERTDEILRIEATQEQLDIQNANVTKAARIAAKKFLTEMDRLLLMSCLSNARMACDSTYLLDQNTQEYSSKLERLADLLEGLLKDPTRKIVIFSEWRKMLDRVESRIEDLGAEYVRLDGQIPQKKRAAIVDRFQQDPRCRVITMTNAGSTGLNLQAANTVINVDLPWNPAVLEQRIARAHRMGQKNHVHVYKLVTVAPGTDETIEERLLDTLASKQELADASLNIDSDVSEVAMVSGMEDLKRRLEVILAPPHAAVDQSQQQAVQAEAERLAAKREKVSVASGQLVAAALSLAGELIDGANSSPPNPEHVAQLSQKLGECVQRDSEGRPQLTIRLPDEASLQGLAQTLAKLLQD
ncbi:DEAD/DEAH box helicase [Roseimaritima sediminicola]|uniref:DEAD/DEAH box helicase n=1 Tax=Roseimaritima sediminicola TaxID=2662066 RepID=UPI0012985416|nr:DEAD/DEAH box helicase [Roseimaritima sediminicola]